MRLTEVLDFPQALDEFELLNLKDAVDEEVLHHILQERDLMLTYNGVHLFKGDNFDSVLQPGYGLVREEFKDDVNTGWLLDFTKTLEAKYNWNNMCLYFTEEYSLTRQDPMTKVKRIEVFQRVEYTNTTRKNHFKLMKPAEYYQQTKLKDELIDLMKALDR